MNDKIKPGRDHHKPGSAVLAQRKPARENKAWAMLAALIVLTSVSPRLLKAQAGQPPQPARMLRIFGARGTGAFLGVTLKEVTAGDVSTMKLPGEYGAIVAQVEPNSPAAKAGLKANDVILEFGGMRVWSAAQLGRLVRETPPGRKVTLRVSRAGEKLNVAASLAQRNELAMMPNFHTRRAFVTPRAFNFDFMFPRRRLGIEVETLTPQLAGYFHVMQGKGVLITEVEAATPAAKAGLKAGDCIVKAGSTEVNSVPGLMRALGRVKGSQVTLSIVRDGHEQTLTSGLEPAPNPLQNTIFKRQMERQIQAIKSQIPRLKEMERQMKNLNEGEV